MVCQWDLTEEGTGPSTVGLGLLPPPSTFTFFLPCQLTLFTYSPIFCDLPVYHYNPLPKPRRCLLSFQVQLQGQSQDTSPVTSLNPQFPERLRLDCRLILTLAYSISHTLQTTPGQPDNISCALTQRMQRPAGERTVKQAGGTVSRSCPNH